MSRPFTKLKDSNVNVYEPSNIEPMLNRIRYLRDEADVVFVIVHWGREYKMSPSTRQKTLARQFVANGADVVMGHHPHVIQPMETLNVKGRSGVVFYSLGNFLFDSSFSKPGVRNSMILKIILKESEDDRYEINFKYLPCVIHPEIGFVPIPSVEGFQSTFPEQVTEIAEQLAKYIDCGMNASCIVD